MSSNVGIEAWKDAAASSNIQPFALMKFALIYWLNKKRETCLGQKLKQFVQLLTAICSINSKILIDSLISL